VEFKTYFSNDDLEIIKQLYLTLMYNQKSWKKKVFGWTTIQRELVEKFGKRYEKHLL